MQGFFQHCLNIPNILEVFTEKHLTCSHEGPTVNKSFLSEQAYVQRRAQDMKELKHHGSRKYHSGSSQFKKSFKRISSDPNLSPAPHSDLHQDSQVVYQFTFTWSSGFQSETVVTTVLFPSLWSEQSPWCKAGWDWLITQIQILTFAFTFP